MKATFLQLQFIEDVEKKFNIKYIDYGFYSNGNIGVHCKDGFGDFSISVDKNGSVVNK